LLFKLNDHHFKATGQQALQIVQLERLKEAFARLRLNVKKYRDWNVLVEPVLAFHHQSSN